MKYKVESTLVEAKQWFKDGDQPDMAFYNDNYTYPAYNWTDLCLHCNRLHNVHAYLETGHAGFPICPKDWIVVPLEIDGERLPPFVVNWIVFDAIYEKMED